MTARKDVSREAAPMIMIGTAGWSIPSPLADVFPGEGTHLQRYARVFTCVEINSSFYRSHAFATYARWADSVPRDFRFSVKVPKLITHEARLRSTQHMLEAFLAEVAGLGTKLGPLLVQLPPSLAFETRFVRTFFTQLRERHAGAVICEPRHASWFTPAAETLLAEHRIGRAAVDPALCDTARVPGGWMGTDGHGAGATAYYRLHGSPRIYWSVYSRTRIEEWAQTLRTLPRSCDVWCIFDNTAAGGAAHNALELINFANERTPTRHTSASV